MSLFKDRISFIIYFLSFVFALSTKANDYYVYGDKAYTYNMFGETGLITLPTANIRSGGNIYFNLTRNDIFNYGSLTVTPFNWLESSYFYYRPTDLWWLGPSTKGKYLDKGFSVKFSKFLNHNTALAVGLSDFAGTGYFSREYIVATHEGKSFRLTSGIGFGRFVYNDGFKNPFSSLLPSLENRPSLSSNYDFGGSLSYDQWFRGNAKIIGGAEFFLRGSLRNTSLKIEYDPYNYIDGFSARGNKGQDLDLRKKDSNLNFGLNIPLGKSFNLGLSYLKGNTINLSISFGGDFSKPFFKKETPNLLNESSNKGSTQPEKFYEDLLHNLKRKNIFLQSASIDKNEVSVAVAANKFRNPIMVHKITGTTLEPLLDLHDIQTNNITTINTNVGNELHRISSPRYFFKNTNNTFIEEVASESVISAGRQSNYQDFEFRPTIKFPSSFTGIAPALVNHIGDPQQFYYGGIVLRLDNELQFARNLLIKTIIHQNITNNFDGKRNFPDSRLPNVRTNIVSYLQESETYIERMQLDYFFSPSINFFGKISAGILESMYSGAGIEMLYKPFNANYSIGLDSFAVKKRKFDRKFGTLDYKQNTGHISLNYHLPKWGILGKLSYGQYLAGDRGYTFDISRRLSSGFRAGIFFTRTNVSPELFGEGSFDKGFYFQIPIDLFLNDYRGGYINFRLTPLTRDGGQKLEVGNDLIGIMHNTSFSEVSRDWIFFND